MRLCINSGVFEKFPSYERFVVVADNVNNSGDGSETIERLRGAELKVRMNNEMVDFKNHPRLASWRMSFEEIGLNPNQCLPSVVALVKRALGGSELPIISPLVAIMNVVSLSHLVPCGGDDLDKVKGDLELGFAAGNENYAPLGKPELCEHPKPGEIIYYDTKSYEVLCRAWCWRNGDVTKIMPSTKRVAINIDIMAPVCSEEGRAVSTELADLVETICGANTNIYHLCANSNSVEI